MNEETASEMRRKAEWLVALQQSNPTDPGGALNREAAAALAERHRRRFVEPEASQLKVPTPEEFPADEFWAALGFEPEQAAGLAANENASPDAMAYRQKIVNAFAADAPAPAGPGDGGAMTDQPVEPTGLQARAAAASAAGLHKEAMSLKSHLLAQIIHERNLAK